MVPAANPEDEKVFEVPPPYRRTLKILVSPETRGVGSLAIGMVTIPPGSKGERHLHKEPDEFWIVVKGKGELIIGDEKVNLEPDVVAWSPRGVLHQIINTGDEELKAYFLYAPPGPEKFILDRISARFSPVLRRSICHGIEA